MGYLRQANLQLTAARVFTKYKESIKIRKTQKVNKNYSLASFLSKVGLPKGEILKSLGTLIFF